MALADISGLGGSVSISGFVFHISEWQLTQNVTTVETTGFSDTGNRTYDPTAVGYSGSCSGTGQSGAAGTSPFGLVAGSTAATPTITTAKVAAAVFTASSGQTVTCTIVIESVSLTRRFDGKLDMSCSFKVSGGVTLAWVVT